MVVCDRFQDRKELLHSVPAEGILDDLHVFHLGTGLRRLICLSHVALREKSTGQCAVSECVDAVLCAVIQKCSLRTAVKDGILRLVGYDRDTGVNHLL